MLIIHSFHADNTFYIWGEQSFNLSDLQFPAESEVHELPWAADSSTLNEALKKLRIRNRIKLHLEKTVSAYTLLPSRNKFPIPSSSILGEFPSDSNTTVLNIYKVQAIPIEKEELYKLSEIIKESGEKPPISGILFGDDLFYISEALEYAASMVIKGSFYPDMEMVKDKFKSRWSPIYPIKYQKQHLSFIANIPPILRSFSLSKDHVEIRSSQETAETILRSLLDGIIRHAQSSRSSGKKISSNNPHEIWVRSLTWPKISLDNWQEEMSSLYPEIKEWTESLKTYTNKPWSLLLRVEEPLAEGSEWTLSWHLQSMQSEYLTLPISRVWAPDEVEKKLFQKDDFNPRLYILQTLGELIAVVPIIATSLNSTYPSDCYLSSEELFDFLQYQLPKIMEHGIEVSLPPSWGSITNRPKPSLKGHVLDKKIFRAGDLATLQDTLNVEWKVAIEDDVLTEEELNSLKDLKTPLANIRGKWLLLYKDEIRKVINGRKKLPSKITRKDALILTFCDTYSNIPISGIIGSKWLNKAKSILTGEGEIEILSQPKEFKGRLRPYQIRGFSWISWIARLGLGCCLADDMGLGKTVQALALIQFLKNEGERRPLLLICPTSVIENWRREAKKFLPELTVFIHHGARRFKNKNFINTVYDYNLVVSSYSLLYRDREFLGKVHWSGIILDEAQNIKNPDTRQAKAAKKIQADWHLALTGTPIENHVGDMWSIMDFLLPGLLPKRSSFIKEFLRPIQAGDKIAIEKIRKLTAPFILRRHKGDKNIISDLPQKIETHVFCSLGKEQATLYNSVVNSLQNNIKKTDGIRRKGLILSTITSLKQICNHPALYLKDKSVIDGRSGKLERLSEIAEEMLSVGDRALIFTQYVEMGDILKRFLQETFGREVLFLHGGLSREKRDELVVRFQESEAAPPFFILSLKAGGTGLNLTKANHVIMFDRWWNPAVEQQAIDRAYRIGQKHNVQVHYFLCKDTLEERIEELIKSKLQIADSVITVGENWLTDLSDQELTTLFALKKDAVGDFK